MEPTVEIVERDREDTAVVRGLVGGDGFGPFIAKALGEVMAGLDGTPVVGPPFCRIDMTGDRFLLEVGFPVGRPVAQHGQVRPSSLPGGTVATVLHVGPYDEVSTVYGFLEEWLRDHGYVPEGAPWETYLDGPEVAEPRTVVCWLCHR